MKAPMPPTNRAEEMSQATPPPPAAASKPRKPAGVPLKIVDQQDDGAVVAHKDAGVGQIGAGLVRPPMSIFEEALVAYAEKYGF